MAELFRDQGAEPWGVGRASIGRGLREQRRARGDEQPDGELDGIDVALEPLVDDEIAEIDVVVERGPRRERDQRGPQGNAGRAGDAQRPRRRSALADVALWRARRGRRKSLQRLDGRDDEDAAEPPQLRDGLAVPEDELDLGGDVEGHPRVRRVERADDRHRVPTPFKKSGSPNVMCRARRRRSAGAASGQRTIVARDDEGSARRRPG